MNVYIQSCWQCISCVKSIELTHSLLYDVYIYFHIYYMYSHKMFIIPFVFVVREREKDSAETENKIKYRDLNFGSFFLVSCCCCRFSAIHYKRYGTAKIFLFSMSNYVHTHFHSDQLAHTPNCSHTKLIERVAKKTYSKC